MTIPEKIQDVYKKSSLLFSTQDIEAALDRMAVDIHQVLHDKNPIILCVMGYCVYSQRPPPNLAYVLQRA